MQCQLQSNLSITYNLTLTGYFGSYNFTNTSASFLPNASAPGYPVDQEFVDAYTGNCSVARSKANFTVNNGGRLRALPLLRGSYGDAPINGQSRRLDDAPSAFTVLNLTVIVNPPANAVDASDVTSRAATGIANNITIAMSNADTPGSQSDVKAAMVVAQQQLQQQQPGYSYTVVIIVEPPTITSAPIPTPTTAPSPSAQPQSVTSWLTHEALTIIESVAGSLAGVLLSFLAWQWRQRTLVKHHRRNSPFAFDLCQALLLNKSMFGTEKGDDFTLVTRLIADGIAAATGRAVTEYAGKEREHLIKVIAKAISKRVTFETTQYWLLPPSRAILDWAALHRAVPYVLKAVRNDAELGRSGAGRANRMNTSNEEDDDDEEDEAIDDTPTHATAVGAINRRSAGGDPVPIEPLMVYNAFYRHTGAATAVSPPHPRSGVRSGGGSSGSRRLVVAASPVSNNTAAETKATGASNRQLPRAKRRKTSGTLGVEAPSAEPPASDSGSSSASSSPRPVVGSSPSVQLGTADTPSPSPPARARSMRRTPSSPPVPRLSSMASSSSLSARSLGNTGSSDGDALRRFATATVPDSLGSSSDQPSTVRPVLLKARRSFRDRHADDE
jgi:hypothetical protein